MSEGTLMLIVLVIVMFFASYVAGMIPLILQLSEAKLKFVTILGAGLLVGTALTVIIPEGIRSLYMGTQEPHKTKIEKSPLASPKDQMDIHHTMESDFSHTIGLSLVLGFISMMLVDQLSQRNRENNAANKKIIATLGLVVHAAADGVALGAAAATTHHDVEIVVFLAIMLHKAPAAFGLVSFLLHEKIERQQICKHLLIFSLSAPLMTLLTYFGIGQEEKETLHSLNATGIAMLFSAGTFLYVATVHVLSELIQNSADLRSNSLGPYDYHTLDSHPGGMESQVGLRSSNGSEVRHVSAGLHYSELVILICGALLPLITVGHHH